MEHSDTVKEVIGDEHTNKVLQKSTHTHTQK